MDGDGDGDGRMEDGWMEDARDAEARRCERQATCSDAEIGCKLTGWLGQRALGL